MMDRVRLCDIRWTLSFDVCNNSEIFILSSERELIKKTDGFNAVCSKIIILFCSGVNNKWLEQSY